jgi:tetratricopeptide (TPR) repeat protein
MAEEIPTNSWKLLYETGRQALQDRKLQVAEQSFSAALQLAEDFAAGDPRLAATLNALARIYSLQRRYLAAAALLNRLLEVTERTLGPTHVQVAGVLTNLAMRDLGGEEPSPRECSASTHPNADATSPTAARSWRSFGPVAARNDGQTGIDGTAPGER